jgi:hypothetical protein
LMRFDGKDLVKGTALWTVVIAFELERAHVTGYGIESIHV